MIVSLKKGSQTLKNVISYPTVKPYLWGIVNAWPGSNLPIVPASIFDGHPYIFLPKGLGLSKIIT